MAEPADAYRIDYDNLDVEDLMQQVRARAQASASRLAPRVDHAELPRRLRAHLDVDDRRAYELRRELDLAGPWNVTPDDLRASGAGIKGRLVGTIRTVFRPAIRAAVNLELPLYKQFKINLGIAEALHDLLRENTVLRDEIADLRRRVERLEHTANDRGED